MEQRSLEYESKHHRRRRTVSTFTPAGCGMSSGAAKLITAEMARGILAEELAAHQQGQELLIAFAVFGAHGTARTLWLSRDEARKLLGIAAPRTAAATPTQGTLVEAAR